MLVFENDRVVIVNKPHNTLVHHSHYARNIREQSLLQLLEERYKRKFYPVHRLDRKTSGLILMCKEKEFVSSYQKALQESDSYKKYLAIVRGFLNENGKITSPVKHPETGEYRTAETTFRTLDKIELDIPVDRYQTSRYTLAELSPVTGRIHQLRIHMNKISHPIIGDHKYGDRHHNKVFDKKFGQDILYLHAQSLSFIDPFTKTLIEENIAPSNHWEKALNLFQ